MRKLAIASVLLAGLSGCANVNTALTAASAFHVTQKDVDDATAVYGASQAIALAYLRLPRCGTPVVQPCARHTTVAVIKADDQAIYQALHDTQAAVSSGNASGAVAAYGQLQTVLTAYQTLTAGLKTS
jgi:hypothetical protein